MYRIWNTEQLRRQKEVIVVRGKNAAQKTLVTSATYSREGKWLAGATQNGEIRIWNSNGPYFRPIMDMSHSYQEGSGVSCIRFAPDDILFASRGNDHALKCKLIMRKKK
jgi:WD40 repeat protein